MEQEFDDFFMYSLCYNDYLHRFSIKAEYPEGVLEVCEICGLDKFFRIIDGKVDNTEYMAWHARQALFPLHPYYYHEREYSPLDDKIQSPYA